MAEEPKKVDVQVFACGGDRCPSDGKPHDFSIPHHDKTGGWMNCSKCGLSEIDHDLLRLP